MRLVSALVLAYCFGCASSESCDDKRKFHKLYPLKSKENALKFVSTIWPVNRIGMYDERLFIDNLAGRCFKNFKDQRRKLLSYSEKDLFHDFEQSGKFDLINAPLLKRGRRNVLKEAKESHSVVWDNWGDWSKCSVTCGTGRQVRWRHCSVHNCTKGLKKAQIKGCHLKNCDSKNILNWFGIKT